MKIVYCIDAAYNLSGTDIVSITKANALATIPGNKVWVVSAGNPRSLLKRLKQVSVTDLNVRYYQHDDEGLIVSIIDFLKTKRIHKKRLENFLETIQPDVVISSGVLTKTFLPTLKISSNPVFIRELHADRHYNRDSAKGIIKKCIALIGELYDFHWKIHAYDKVVVLTEKENSGSWKNWKKLAVIPNPITHWTGALSQCEEKVAITAGRLAPMKNFTGLINIWSKVAKRHPDWMLQIWGTGDMQLTLEKQIKQLGLEKHVCLMGYTDKIGEKMSQASLMVLTSRSESFSLVTLEAMSAGIPTIVYNCPGGISQLVKDGETGYLVPLDNEDIFVERVCQLIEDNELRRKMGMVSAKESEQYNIENIISRWMSLFEELLLRKRKNQTD